MEERPRLRWDHSAIGEGHARAVGPGRDTQREPQPRVGGDRDRHLLIERIVRLNREVCAAPVRTPEVVFFFEVSLYYACPEPVLVKRSLLHSKL